MKFAICDSSSYFMSKFIEEMRKIDSSISIDLFNGYKDLIDADNLLQYDSFFIATEIERQSGVDIALKVYLETKAEIVFVTENCEKYCQSIFEYSDIFKPFAMLNKPVSRLFLRHVVEMLEKVSEQCKGKNIIVRLVDKNQISISVIDILYIQHNNRVSYIYTCDGNCYESKCSIAWFEENLPNNFLHCAKSCIVNATKVKSIDEMEIVLSDNSSVWCSRRYQKEFIDNLTKFRAST